LGVHPILQYTEKGSQRYLFLALKLADGARRGHSDGQACLFGVLMKVHSLNLALISVNRSESETKARS
jgi:hypothetical protein